MEFPGKLSSGVSIKVVDELLAMGLERCGFFSSYRSRSGGTFFTLFPFIGVRLFSRLLVCGLCCSARPVRSLLVLITVVAGDKHNQSEKYRRERNKLECGHRLPLS